MGENIAQAAVRRRPLGKKVVAKPTSEILGRRLLEIIVYAKSCRIGGRMAVDDLAETSEVGDWKMPDFKLACTYAASQGWLLVQDDTLTLTTAGLAAA